MRPQDAGPCQGAGLPEALAPTPAFSPSLSEAASHPKEPLPSALRERAPALGKPGGAK